MDDSVRAFYDELAENYDLLFADWRASMERQAQVLDRLLRSNLGDGPLTILDAACGIGTQAIGLARLGHRIHATDLSPAAVARAAREARRLGAALTFGVADLRSLAVQVPGLFDAVLACDNVLPHLLHDDDLDLAIKNMVAKIRPGGVLLTSIRDYDRLIHQRPRSEGPRVFAAPEGLRIAFQVWEWAEDGHQYRLRQFIIREDGDAWRTDHFATEYRALLRVDLDAALRRASLSHIAWHEPEASGFFQPIVTARKP